MISPENLVNTFLSSKKLSKTMNETMSAIAGEEMTYF